jgi:Ala-tRNA(Pro) deacylase
MPVEKLKRFLDENHVKYVTISHSRAYTAQEVADSAHIAGKEMAKTVMVKLRDRIAMAVVPAPDMVSIERMQAVTGEQQVAIATEQEFAGLFPNCEVGAMPPFGNLWELDVFVDQRLREDEQIAFNAGSHTELVRLAYGDFERLVEPTIAHISTRPE